MLSNTPQTPFEVGKSAPESRTSGPTHVVGRPSLNPWKGLEAGRWSGRGYNTPQVCWLADIQRNQGPKLGGDFSRERGFGTWQ